MKKFKKIALVFSITLSVIAFCLFYLQNKSNYTKNFSFNTVDSLNALIRITNNGNKWVKFNFSLNKRFYSSLNNFIRENSNSSDSEQIVLNLFNSFINSVVHENLFNNWGPIHITTINSKGFAICGWQAEIFSQILYNAGFCSRVICLNGHVVSEVFYNGNWHLFDVDGKIFFKSEKILGYEELIKNPNYTTKLNPKKYISNLTALSEKYRNFFVTTDDNNFIYITNKNKDTFLINLPPNSSFVFPYYPDIKKDFLLYNTKAKLILPKGFRGYVKNPLVLINIEGKGKVKYNKREFTVPESIELLKANIFLSEQFEDKIYVEVLSDSLSLIYMLNPIFTVLNKENTFSINASDSLIVSLIRNNETSNKIINKPVHIDLLNKYTLFAFDLANKNILNNAKNLNELYNQQIKSYCIINNIDTQIVRLRFSLLEKIQNEANLSLLNDPNFYSVLAILLHSNNEEFKNLYMLYYKKFTYNSFLKNYENIIKDNNKKLRNNK